MGVQKANPATLPQLGYLLSIIPKDAEWNLAGISTNQISTLFGAMGGGGHVRVSMEDNQHLSKGVKGTMLSLLNALCVLLKKSDAKLPQAMKHVQCSVSRKNNFHWTDGQRYGFKYSQVG